MAYVKGRDFAPTGDAWDRAVAYWQTLKSDDDAVFDREYRFDAACIEPRITYGTNPGMGIAVTGHIPTLESIESEGRASFAKSLRYMGSRRANGCWVTR